MEMTNGLARAILLAGTRTGKDLVVERTNAKPSESSFRAA
jgi:hypothetical protein